MIAAWNRWWFGAADPRVMALLRIGWALLALWTTVPMWDDITWALSDEGVLPMDVRATWYPGWRISLIELFGLGGVGELQVYFGVLIGLLVMTAAGLGSRVVFPLAWLGVISLANRNAMWSDGSDAILRVMGFYMLFMPLGRAWSLDAMIRKAKDTPVSLWPLRLFQLNVCLLYVKTGLIKILDTRWQDGEAIYYALSTPAYWRFPMQDLLASSAFQSFTVVMTYATPVFEIAFPLILLRRLRRPMLVLGLGLHAGIWLLMNLGAFSEAILWCYLAFLVLPAQEAVSEGPEHKDAVSKGVRDP